MQKQFQVFSILLLAVAFALSACAQTQQTIQKKENPMSNTLPGIKKDSSQWNKLTAAEARVIEDKGTEYPGTGELLAIIKKALISVAVAMLHYIVPILNLTATAAGPVLMMKFPVLLQGSPIRMEKEQKLNVPIAAPI